MCEGIWQTRCGQCVVVARCEFNDGRQWTDGVHYYIDDGSIWGDDRARSRHDLVAFVRPLPDNLQPDQAAEIKRLQDEWQTEFRAAQQLRSQVEQLERLLDDARDNLRVLEADGTAMDHHCEGMKAAFLAVIKTFVEARA